MSGEDSAAERAVVTKLARGSLLSRMRGSKQPLKLVAVPRNHVHGDRQRGEALLAGPVEFRDRDHNDQGSRLWLGWSTRSRGIAAPGLFVAP